MVQKSFAFFLSASFLLIVACSMKGNISPDHPKQTLNLSGQIVSISDVMNQPDQPLLCNVLIFKVGFFDQWVQDNTISYLPKIGIQMLDSLYRSNVVAQIHTDTQGHYQLQLDPGTYYVCIANIGDQPSPKVPPTIIWGAYSQKLSPNQKHKLMLGWGFSGLQKIE